MPRTVRREDVVFNGLNYSRYPDSKNESDRKYFRKRHTGMGYLHRHVWEFYNGLIPEDLEVNHIDGDTSNNDIGNLELLTIQEHRRIDFDRHGCTPAMFANLQTIRPLAAEWHGSQVGHLWHIEHGKDGWKNAIYRTEHCICCNNEYQTRAMKSGKFCSNKCKSKWRRMSGVDDEDRICIFCQTTFRINKYDDSRCCSRACSGKFRSKQPVV